MALTGAIFVLDMATTVVDAAGLPNSVAVTSVDVVRAILHAGSLAWILVWNRDIRDKLAAKFPSYFRTVVESEQPFELTSTTGTSNVSA